jgi:hypothetical protein
MFASEASVLWWEGVFRRHASRRRMVSGPRREAALRNAEHEWRWLSKMYIALSAEPTPGREDPVDFLDNQRASFEHRHLSRPNRWIKNNEPVTGRWAKATSNHDIWAT